MSDAIHERFIRHQMQQGLQLSYDSDLVDIVPASADGSRFVAHYTCTGLIEAAPGQIVEANSFHVGIWFPEGYLRSVQPQRVLTWLSPAEVWHPNIAPAHHAICAGRLQPGTPLVDLVTQVFELITWNKATIREDDALNWRACEWARHHRDRFPVDRRPLRRRHLDIRAIDCSEVST